MPLNLVLDKNLASSRPFLETPRVSRSVDELRKACVFLKPNVDLVPSFSTAGANA